MEREDFHNQELSQREAERQAEARAMVEKINDPRLQCDEHLEYFTIHLQGRVRHVPKRRVRESAEINRYIEGQLREILEKEN